MFARVVQLAIAVLVVPLVALAAPACPPNASPWHGSSLSVSGTCSDSSFVQRGGYVYNKAGEPYCTCDSGFRCIGSECQCRFSGESALTLSSANRTASACVTTGFPYNSKFSWRSSQPADCFFTWQFDNKAGLDPNPDSEVLAAPCHTFQAML